MMLVKRILILEDHLTVLSKLLEKLGQLEDRQPFEFSITIINDSEQVKNLINANPRAKFDIILLDRDCKVNKSFHVLEIEHFGAKKVIAISSVPEYNKEAKQRGVTRVVLKDLQYIDEFATKVVKEVEKMFTPSRLLNLS